VVEKKVTRKRIPVPCECRCGGMTRGGHFLPGHDARLKSQLLAVVRSSRRRPNTRLVALANLRERGWVTESQSAALTG
jgi:hypothetical protein